MTDELDVLKEIKYLGFLSMVGARIYKQLIEDHENGVRVYNQVQRSTFASEVMRFTGISEGICMIRDIFSGEATIENYKADFAKSIVHMTSEYNKISKSKEDESDDKTDDEILLDIRTQFELFISKEQDKESETETEE